MECLDFIVAPPHVFDTQIIHLTSLLHMFSINFVSTMKQIKAYN